MLFQSFRKIPRLSKEVIVTEKLDGTNGQVACFTRSMMINQLIQEGYPISQIETLVDCFIAIYSIYSFIDGDDVEFDTVYMFAGSRKKWLSLSKNGDNYGFCNWVFRNKEELAKLGRGLHYGEWYGLGIQRKYGLAEKKFALFNTDKWHQSGSDQRLISEHPKTKIKRYTSEAPKCCEVVSILYQGLFDTDEINQIISQLQLFGSAHVPTFMKPEGVVIYHRASGQLFKRFVENDEIPKTINKKCKVSNDAL